MIEDTFHIYDNTNKIIQPINLQNNVHTSWYVFVQQNSEWVPGVILEQLPYEYYSLRLVGVNRSVSADCIELKGCSLLGSSDDEDYVRRTNDEVTSEAINWFWMTIHYLIVL